MSRSWPFVRWERVKFWRWVVRNPRLAIACGRYCRAMGMHLSSADRFRGVDLSNLPTARRIW